MKLILLMFHWCYILQDYIPEINQMIFSNLIFRLLGLGII